MKFAEYVLSTVIRDIEFRESMIGDLREEAARYARRFGAARASRWHLRQSLGIAARYGVIRMLRRKPPVRWISLAAAEPDGPWWSGFPRDIRYAWRAIGQRPALSSAIVLTLALALAANSTTFSLLDALVLRPYRFTGIDRLIVATTAAADDQFFDRLNVTGADFREWRAQSTTVKAWAMYSWWEPNLSGVDIPEVVPGFKVSPGFFKLLGVTPVIGRDFVEDEAQIGRHRRVVLGHALWTRRFASDPNVIGKSVRFDGESYEVVGVAPPGFTTPDGAEVWAPLALSPEEWANRRAESYGLFGSLADGQTVDTARAELTAIADAQRRDHPDTNSKREARVMTFTRGMADPGAGPFIGIWQAAALLLLLIACANIANLLMARGAERTAEYSLRLALGASRARLFRQTLLEGLLLSAIAIALSMPLIGVGLGVSRASIPASVLRFVPGWSFIRIDLDLFAVTAALGTAAMIVFSLLPAFQAMRSQVAEALRQSGRTSTASRQRQFMRSALAATQVALALALLFASTLAITAADRSVNGMLGFDKNNVLVAQLNLPERSYADAETRRQFVDRVTSAMRTIPAASAVGTVSIIPAAFNNSSRKIYPEGRNLTEPEARFAEFRRANSDYFAAVKIPLLRGRWFDASDRLDSMPVAVISDALARRYWPDQDPIGKRFKIAIDGPWLNVIGVSGNIVHNWFVRQPEQFYVPISQDAPYSVAFAVRTVGDPNALAGDLRRAIAAVDADQPIASLSTLSKLVEDRAGGFSFIARALGAVGAIALVLSVMGIYSLMAFLATQRTQEIGVRMALGARRWQVVRAITRRAVGITIAGAAAGAALAFAIGRLMESLLFGITTNSPAQLAAITAILASAALIAAYLPARRAAAIDPMSALRQP
ncbi:MAG TPA: ADOP family duplicated permease [Vicinamibacterales bacterium]|nr:ADOP family duplicated permease [Vicinamibacterales bacterium]